MVIWNITLQLLRAVQVMCIFRKINDSMSLKQAVYKKEKEIPGVQNVQIVPVLKLIDKILEYIKPCQYFLTFFFRLFQIFSI